MPPSQYTGKDPVSTHSRPKAAGHRWRCCRVLCAFQHTAARRRLRRGCRGRGGIDCFNTQPPEGGCVCQCPIANGNAGFNTQPPEGGCFVRFAPLLMSGVSTHSRPKAAAFKAKKKENDIQFQHTAARRRLHRFLSVQSCSLSFNTQPPEGG